MNIKKISTMIGIVLFSGYAFSQDAAPSDAEFNKKIHDYLISNPGVLIEMSNLLQKQQMEKVDALDKDKIKKYSASIFSDSDDPVMGNLEGKKYLVEFIDYNCGYCKRSYSLVSELLKKNSDIKLIVKEYPILSDSSTYAAKAALAVNALYPEKFASFHDALMTQPDHVTNEIVASVVSSLGMNWKKISELMETKPITLKLAQNQSLAQTLDITGTPAFVLTKKIVRGAPQSMTELQAMVE